MTKIILASKSAGRKKVLEDLGIKFTVIPADIDERIITAPSPFLLVKKLARMKAEITANKIKHLTFNKNFLIIGADSTAIIEEKMVKDKKLRKELAKYRLGEYLVLGKPVSKSEAITFLTCLSDNIHYFITGLCIMGSKAKAIHQSITKTTIIFNRIDPEFMEKYTSIQPVLTYAGAYQIEKGTPGANFVRELKGSFTNVLGLPKERILKLL